MADRELLQQALEALETARDYVNAEYVSRSNLYAAYPHRWATERQDLAQTDATIAALRVALAGVKVVPTALARFNDNADVLADETPLERLRYFLSLALNGQDWLDVEPFLDALGVNVPFTACSVKADKTSAGVRVVPCRHADQCNEEGECANGCAARGRSAGGKDSA